MTGCLLAFRRDSLVWHVGCFHDAGSNDLILPDIVDLDRDRDSAELLPVHLYDVPRIYYDTVDIGANEWSRIFQFLPIALD